MTVLGWDDSGLEGCWWCWLLATLKCHRCYSLCYVPSSLRTRSVHTLQGFLLPIAVFANTFDKEPLVSQSCFAWQRDPPLNELFCINPPLQREGWPEALTKAGFLLRPSSLDNPEAPNHFWLGGITFKVKVDSINGWALGEILPRLCIAICYAVSYPEQDLVAPYHKQDFVLSCPK